MSSQWGCRRAAAGEDPNQAVPEGVSVASASIRSTSSGLSLAAHIDVDRETDVVQHAPNSVAQRGVLARHLVALVINRGAHPVNGDHRRQRPLPLPFPRPLSLTLTLLLRRLRLRRCRRLRRLPLRCRVRPLARSVPPRSDP